MHVLRLSLAQPYGPEGAKVVAHRGSYLGTVFTLPIHNFPPPILNGIIIVQSQKMSLPILQFIGV